MSTVLGIVRGLHGAIQIRSAPGKGTMVRILLPAVAKGSPPHDSDSLPAGITAGGKEGSRTILLVDDEFKIRRLARTMLERLGYRVLAASGGMEAIRIYREKFREIHCVLIDLSMPELNGKAVFEKLRRLDPDICVILSSSYTEADVMAQFGDRRPAGFIQKPYRFQSLGTKLKAILDQTPSDR
jgi:DNA-binding NtrC family response regulator